jgi:SAM-dependent methyltransferase
MQRLILGPGKHWKKEVGDTFLDIRPFENVDVVHDLNERPWPFEDGAFLHVSAIHVIEHLKDLISFMDEAWRVLEQGGTLYIETPEAGGDIDLTHCDPTHVRCYRKHTFWNYFTKEGIEKFGYTDKPWAIAKCEVENNCIIFHGMPIK